MSSRVHLKPATRKKLRELNQGCSKQEIVDRNQKILRLRSKETKRKIAGNKKVSFSEPEVRRDLTNTLKIVIVTGITRRAASDITYYEGTFTDKEGKHSALFNVFESIDACVASGRAGAFPACRITNAGFYMTAKDTTNTSEGENDE